MFPFCYFYLTLSNWFQHSHVQHYHGIVFSSCCSTNMNNLYSIFKTQDKEGSLSSWLGLHWHFMHIYWISLVISFFIILYHSLLWKLLSSQPVPLTFSCVCDQLSWIMSCMRTGMGMVLCWMWVTCQWLYLIFLVLCFPHIPSCCCCGLISTSSSLPDKPLFLFPSLRSPLAKVDLDLCHNFLFLQQWVI